MRAIVEIAIIARNKLEAESLEKSIILESEGTESMIDIKREDQILEINIEETNKKIWLSKISRLISSHILSYYQVDIIYGIIDYKMPFLKEDEKKSLYDRYTEKINKGNFFQTLANIQQISRINQEVQNYLVASDMFIIHGFVKFRLKEYVEYLEKEVESMILEVQKETEEENFVSLLETFISSQAPKLKIVYIIQEKKDEYIVIDDKGKRTSIELDKNGTSSDNLIGFLISYIPKKIVLKGEFQDKKVIDFIKNLFEGRVIEEV